MNATLDLLARAAETVEEARALGADEVEVMVDRTHDATVDLQKDDIHNAGVAEETTFGIRVFVNKRQGFVTVNDPERLRLACEEAVALARASPADPLNGLRDPEPVIALESGPDARISDLGVGDLVDLASALLERIQQRDQRVRIDSGSVSSQVLHRALATSTGIRLEEQRAVAGGSFFGMAVDGDDVGSFDYDGQVVVDAGVLREELEAAADRFVIKTTGALGARKGETFRGPVVLSPEVVDSFVLGNLMAGLKGRSVRTGKSPFADRLGHRIASPMIRLLDDPRRPSGVASAAFDREGSPTSPLVVLDEGVLHAFLYDVYEARAAGTVSTGHARGGASTSPSVGTTNLALEPGDQAFTRLCVDPPRTVVASRFSGSCNPITGEFSGVVKGGFLMRDGERVPIKETLIAGNLHQLLQNVSGISAECRLINGRSLVPACRVEDVSITAG